MGYTHYWKLEPTILPTDANIIIGEILGRAYTRGIVQRDYDDTREPILSDTEIQFNGVGDNAQETFHFTIPSQSNATGTFDVPSGGQPAGRQGEHADSDWTSYICLTARMPYDEIVMQVLIGLKYYLGEAIVIESDGDFDSEWAAARQELESRYGIRVAKREVLERVTA